MATTDSEDGGLVEWEKPPRAKRLRAEQRREELLDAAETVIRRVGGKVSAGLIAREAGVTKPIIYRHFDDIQDLYRALAVRHEARLEHWLQAERDREPELDRHGRFQNFASAFLTAIEREPNLYQFLVHTGADSPDQPGGLSWFTRIWAHSFARHLMAIHGDPANSPAATAMGFALVGTMTTVGNWWLESDSVPKEVVADAIARVMIFGLPVASERLELAVPPPPDD